VAERDSLDADVNRLDVDLANLAEACAKGGDIPALVKAMKHKQAARDAASRRVVELTTAIEQAEAKFELLQFIEASRPVLEHLQEQLHADPPLARQVLRRLLSTPITLGSRAEEDGTITFEFSGATTFAGLDPDTWEPRPTDYQDVAGKVSRRAGKVCPRRVLSTGGTVPGPLLSKG